MTRRTSTDLRARMQKVATKPPQHPDSPRRTRAATPDRTSAATAGRAGAPKAGRTRAAAPRTRPLAADVEAAEPLDALPRGRTRIETLAGWASWEVIAIPRKRLRFMRDLLLGG